MSIINKIRSLGSIRVAYGVEAICLIISILFNWNILLWVLVVENVVSFLIDISILKSIIELVGFHKTKTTVVQK